MNNLSDRQLLKELRMRLENGKSSEKEIKDLTLELQSVSKNLRILKHLKVTLYQIYLTK